MPTNSTPDHKNKQLSLFENIYSEKVRRAEIEGVMHFSIYDVLQHYGSEGSAKNPHVYWANAQKKLEGQGAEAVLKQVLLLQFPGERQRKTPVAPFKFFLRLAQVIDIKEWEWLRQWMVDAAHERMEEALNPGLGTARAFKRDLALMERAGLGKHEAADRLRTRIGSVESFKALASHIVRLSQEPATIGAAVNREYLALFGRVTSELRALLNTDNVRDALPNLQLKHVELIETDLNEIFKRQDRMTPAQILDTVSMVSRPLGEHLRMICEQLGIDPVTGKPMLPKGAYHA